MTTADYALIVSLGSVAISLVALLWNVWQKYIFVKPNLQVGFAVMKVFHPGSADHGKQLLCLTVTNMGPGPATLAVCTAKMTRLPRWWPGMSWLPGWPRHPGFGMLNPIHGDPLAAEPRGIGPYAGGLPMKIDAADSKSFYFPYTKDCFLKDPLVAIGINDTYHRIFWCRRRDMKKAQKRWREDFAHSSPIVAGVHSPLSA